jgi:hypothetical protein
MLCKNSDKNLASFRNLNFFLYRHKVSEFLTSVPGDPPGIPPANERDVNRSTRQKISGREQRPVVVAEDLL